MNHSSPSNLRLVLRALEPSSASLLACFGIGVLIVAAHVVLLSLSYGTVLPSIFNGEFAAGYTNHIVQPLEVLFNNSIYSRIIVMVVWGVIGLAFYTVVAGFGGFFGRWREAEQDVQMVSEGRYVHPLRRSFVRGVLWRVALGAVGVTAIVLLQPLFRWMFSVDGKLFANSFAPRDLRNIFLSMFLWALLMHGTIVFLRLYLLRTRLLGEIIE